MKQYDSKDYVDANTHLSSVMDAASTCEDGFMEKEGVVSPMTKGNNDTFHLSAMALSIVHLIGSGTRGSWFFLLVVATLSPFVCPCLKKDVHFLKGKYIPKFRNFLCLCKRSNWTFLIGAKKKLSIHRNITLLILSEKTQVLENGTNKRGLRDYLLFEEDDFYLSIFKRSHRCISAIDSYFFDYYLCTGDRWCSGFCSD